MLGKILNALVLEAHTIQHSARSLGHTRIVIALSRLIGRTLHDDTAYATKVHYILELNAVTKRPACRHHRITKLKPSYIRP